MQKSAIEHVQGGGVVMSGPDAVSTFRCLALAGVINLTSLGIKVRAVPSMRKALDLAHEITGKGPYKRTQWRAAKLDLKTKADEFAAKCDKVSP